MRGGVFISYRREDSAGFAGRIYDRLRANLGPDSVFIDVDNIPATLRATMARTRQSTIGLFAGAAWGCSTRFSPNWRARAANRSGS